MCGILGFFDFERRFGAAAQEAVCRRMADTLRHRGPDDDGVWTAPEAGVSFGHRRLSILDLSPLGRQPMQSGSGRYTVTYNGELYNFRALRASITDYPFEGTSDTEVLLAAVETWGTESALRRFDGMFSFALWDEKKREVTIARDRFGEKPLYYGLIDGSFVFSSELKALHAYPKFQARIDRSSLAQYMRYGYVPAPFSIYEGIRKLPPACSLVVSKAEDVYRKASCYWQYDEMVRKARSSPFSGSDEEATDELERLLCRVVPSRAIADVPVGAFLSGGIDSSTVVAILQATVGKTRTFTIGFDEAMFDEAKSAKAVADQLGTQHTEMYISSGEAQEVIPLLPRLYDEPFGDASQIPTFLVSRLARADVAVALSGDAGDELFGGYNRYIWAQKIWSALGPIPTSMRKPLGYLVPHASPAVVDEALAKISRHLPVSLRVRAPGDKLQKLLDLMPAASAEDLYLRLVSSWHRDDLVVGAGSDRRVAFGGASDDLSFVDRMMSEDATTYLPDDILAKVDRAAMGVSLETRVPFLSPEIASFAWSLPSAMKIRGGSGKWIVKEVLGRYLPKALFERPKMGFAVPIDAWLRGPLRSWAEELLSEKRLERDGYLMAAPIRQKWHEHLTGRRNWQDALWHVLMFQSWLDTWSPR